MDKPKIVAIHRPEDESEVPPEREPQQEPSAEQQKTPTNVETQPVETPQTGGANPEAAVQTAPQAEAKPERPEKQAVGPDGLTDLERSVLDEMRKRGEISLNEERAIAQEARARNDALSQPTAPPAPKTERPVGAIEAPAEKPAGEMEVASEEQHPRVIAGAPPWVSRQAKPIIKQTRVNGVVVSERGESAGKQTEDHLAQPQASGDHTQDERERAADLARKIYARKQREKSFFYRLQKMLGLVKEEPLVTQRND
jgi:hypothetical protein